MNQPTNTQSPELEGLRIASARAKDLFDFARSSKAPQPQLDVLMTDWQDAMTRYHEALRKA